MSFLRGQSPDDFNEGSRLTHNAFNDTFSLSWWGRAGHHYFVEISEDLLNWDVLPIVEEGFDDPIEWTSAMNAGKLFYRIHPINDLAIESVEAAEEDGSPFAPGQLLDDRETTYFRIVLSPQLPSIDAALLVIWGLVLGDRETYLNESNTQFSNDDGKTILLVTVEPEDWDTSSQAMPSSWPSPGPRTKASFDTGSIDPLELSNLTDSDAFIEEFQYDDVLMEPVVNLGRASEKPGDLPLHIDGIRYAGWSLELGQTLSLEELNVPYTLHVYNQARFYYYSGHGSHSSGTLNLGESLLTADDVKWDDGLEVVIIAGCSVLDINDYNNNTSMPAGWKPGDAWSKTGPRAFLGYNWEAPRDRQQTAHGYVYAAKNIITSWINRRGVSGDVHAWMEANESTYGRNASAIDVSQGVGNRTYWYWRRVSFGGQTLYYALENVHESQW